MTDLIQRIALALKQQTPQSYDAQSAPSALSPLYEALAPAPNTEYGTILPVARDTVSGEKRAAMPNIFREGLGGILDLMAGTETGQVTPRAAETLALGGLGGGMAAAPKGVFASGGAPIKAYHGSPNDFRAFDINRAGSTTDPGSLGRAIYAATDPKVAESRAHKYELSINPQNPLNISLKEWGGKEAAIREALGLPSTATAQEVSAAARAKGHDAAILDYSPVGYPHQEIAAYDPAIIEIMRKYGLMAPAPVAAPPEQSRSIFEKVY